MMKKIVIGSDTTGVALKKAIKEHLTSKGYEMIDLGTDAPENFVTYCEIGSRAAIAVQNGVAEKGIIICGSGLGVSLTANKYKGIYAGLVESELTTESSRIVNNCNILAMGAKIISEARAIRVVDIWLNTEFAQGADEKRREKLQTGLDDLARIEGKNFK